MSWTAFWTIISTCLRLLHGTLTCLSDILTFPRGALKLDQSFVAVIFMNLKYQEGISNNQSVLTLERFWSKNFFRRAEQKFFRYWIRLKRNARHCNACSGEVGSSHCYLDQRPLHEMATFDEIVWVWQKTISAIGNRCIIESNF